MTQTVKSADESTIAYEKSGTGASLIIIGGAFNVRQSAGDIARLLAAHFSVYAYDRRGRGDSTETTPSSVQREVEDLAALIDAAGGSAMVYGHSSGAVLALEAAASGLPITKLALYEPPYTAGADDVGGGGERVGNSIDGWGDSIQAAVDVDDRERAALLFMQGTGVDAATTEGMKQLPWWPGILAVAHTLPYDVALLGDGSVPTERFAKITVPTLLMHGGDSPAWAGIAASTIAEAIPHAKQVTVQGQDHNVDPATIAPEITDFFR